eukprot:11716806-Alexandrium_andersonii.AAC.1
MVHRILQRPQVVPCDMHQHARLAMSLVGRRDQEQSVHACHIYTDGSADVSSGKPSGFAVVVLLELSNGDFVCEHVLMGNCQWCDRQCFKLEADARNEIAEICAVVWAAAVGCWAKSCWQCQ